MAFIDELTIGARAGRGGDGVVRWLHLKGKDLSGPAGGDGGNGGDVRVCGVRDISALRNLRFKKVFSAQNGEHGKSNNMYGKNGEDCIISIPVGSIVTNTETNEQIEIIKEGECYTILKGGRGGLGNTRFKSSRNTKPEESTPGREGAAGTFHIELRLIADAGFVGYPNAGKSSLLNELTRAQARVGSYEFTTLDPNLGEFYGFILADIPGLIEGASTGKGLGHKFLRHIARTSLIIHCISFERENLVQSYKAIRKELESFGGLSEKEEIIVLTKTDLVSEEDVAGAIKELERETGRRVFTTSIGDDVSIKKFADTLTAILRA